MYLAASTVAVQCWILRILYVPVCFKFQRFNSSNNPSGECYKEILIINTACKNIHMHTHKNTTKSTSVVLYKYMLQLSCREREGGHLELKYCDLR